MQNPQDDNYLDRLSREAAEQYEPDQQLHSWDKLQPALDIALPQKKEKKRWFLILLFLFLLTGGGILFSAIWNNRNESRKEVAGDPTEITKPENKQDQPATTASDPAKTKKETTTTSGPETTANVPADAGKTSTGDRDITGVSVRPDSETSIVPDDRKKVSNQPVISTKTSSRKFAGNKKNLPADRTRTDRISRFIQPSSDETTRNPVKDKKINEQTGKTDQKLAKQEKEPDKSLIMETVITDSQKINPDLTRENKKVEKTIETPTADSTISKNQPAETKTGISTPAAQPKDSASIPVTAIKKKDRSPSTLKNRWEFGLTFAPDISTVKFTHTQKPGVNAGLTIGYNLTRRFSVQTGLLYTKKNYKSYGEDYHPPKGYWTDYIDLETVTGNCDMLDLPLNLRYNLAPRKTSNLFVSTGLSTYFMRKEYYDYFYYYNGNPTTRSRSYPTDSKYWFSVVNISIGYEKQVSRTFSVQAEPFFKQPLKGVGFGSMKLNTTGIYFSLKYKPQMKAQKTPVKQ